MNNRSNTSNLGAASGNTAGNRTALDADAFVAALLQQQSPQTNQAAVRSPASQAAGASLMGSGAVPARRGATRGRGSSTRGGGLSRQQQPAGTGLSPLGSQQFTNVPSPLQAASLPLQSQQSQQQPPQRSASVASRGRPAGRGATQRTGARASAQATDQQAALASLLGLGAAPATAGAGSLAPPQQSAGARRPRAAGTAGAVANAGTANNLLGQQGGGQQQQQQQRQALSLGAQATNAGALSNVNNLSGLFGQQDALGQSQQRATRRPRSAAAGAQTQPTSLGAVNFVYGDGMADDNKMVDGALSNKKKYILVSQDGHREGPQYLSSSANGAALKAATTGRTDIYLWDRNHKAAPGGRVYSYAGGSAPITNPSEFTMKHGITTKPMVKSRGYVDLDANYAPMERR
nr:hypothetical protein [Pandoravirus aubagnensis]